MSSTRNSIVYLRTDSYCAVYNLETQDIKEFSELPLKPENSKYFDQLLSIVNFNHIKAFVFTSYLSKRILNTVENYEFRSKCREFAQKHGIFCYFPNPCHVDAVAAITHTKTTVKEGEEILMVVSTGKTVPPAHMFLKRENGDNKITEVSGSRLPSYSPSWKKDILGNHKPKTIILTQSYLYNLDPNAFGKMKKLFKGENVKKFLDSKKYRMMTEAAIVQQLMVEKYDEYYVKPTSLPKFEVRFDGNVFIKASYLDILPFEKSVVINVNSKKNVSLYCSYSALNATPLDFVKEIKLSTFKCTKVTVTLKIDINSFYDFKVEPIDDEKEEEEHSIIAQTKAENDELVAPERARMIFDKDNFSILYFSNNKEKILTDSDGSNKTPIFLSFAEKKPVIGRDARNDYVENSESVVFDLIKLCSITNTNINNPNWDFKLSKENDTIIVTMQTFDGEKKSTVDFLLALIIKNGNDRIKKAYGKKMKDIEIGFDGFVPNEMLKKNFIEAGKLLNLNIVFV